MNERIKLLAEQAQIGIFEDKAFGWSVIAGTDQHLAKFAQLIVKECLNQCYNRGMNDELYAGQLQAAAYIEEHFGVEE